MTQSFVYDWPASMNGSGVPSPGKKTLPKGTVSAMVTPLTAALAGWMNTLAMRKSTTTVSGATIL